MRVGFTGTRNGMTEAQYNQIDKMLRSLDNFEAAHHGDCVGADAQFHQIVRNIDERIEIVGHPPIKQDHRAFCDCDAWAPEQEYLHRNKDIVRMSSFLIAAPADHGEVLRSGTWSTIRYSREMDVPRLIVFPDGTVSEI